MEFLTHFLLLRLKDSRPVMNVFNARPGINYAKDITRKEIINSQRKTFIHSIVSFGFKKNTLSDIDLDKLDVLVEENEKKLEKMAKQSIGRKLSYKNESKNTQNEGKNTDISNHSEHSTPDLKNTSRAIESNYSNNINTIESFNPDNLNNDNDIVDDDEGDDQEIMLKNQSNSSNTYKTNHFDANKDSEKLANLASDDQQGSINRKQITEQNGFAADKDKVGLARNNDQSKGSSKNNDFYNDLTKEKKSSVGNISLNNYNETRKMPFNIFVPIFLSISMVAIFVYSILIQKGVKSLKPRKIISSQDDEAMNLLGERDFKS